MKDYSKKFIQSVHHVYSNTNSIRSTANTLGVSRELVQKIINPPPNVSTNNNAQYLEEIITQDSTLYLKEMKTKLWQNHLVWRSTSTICRILKAIKLKRKKLDEHAIERFTDESKEKRLNYLASIAEVPVENLYFLDETGVDLNTIKRKYGRASVGKKASTIRKYVRTKRLNLLSCIGWKGLTGYRIIEDATSSIDFNSFVNDLLPAIPLGSVLVIDNASFHQAAALQAAVELQGMQLIFLPPYSPDLNPIELSYGWLKSNLRSELELNWRKFDMAAAISLVYSSITDELTQNWFNKCFYFSLNK